MDSVPISYQSLFFFQLYVGEQQRISSFKASLSLLSASPNKVLSDLIATVKESYKCKFGSFPSAHLVILGERDFYSPLLVIKQHVSHVLCVMNFTFSFLFSLPALPAGSRIEDLLTLASQDIEPTTDESMQDTGTSFLCEHQKLMLQHFDSTETAILPDHVV